MTHTQAVVAVLMLALASLAASSILEHLFRSQLDRVFHRLLGPIAGHLGALAEQLCELNRTLRFLDASLGQRPPGGLEK